EEADQQIRGEADAFPSDKQQNIAVGQNQREHEKHEQVQVREEAIVAAFFRHVSDRVNVDEKADSGHDEQHRHRELVEIEAKIYAEALAHLHPGKGEPLDVGKLRLRQCGKLRDHPDGIGQCGAGKEQRNGGNQAAWKALAKDAIDGRANQRQDRDQPQIEIGTRSHSLSRFTWSTFKVSRVRKTARTIASPTAASAAATTITKNTKTCPLTWCQ